MRVAEWRLRIALLRAEFSLRSSASRLAQLQVGLSLLPLLFQLFHCHSSSEAEAETGGRQSNRRRWLALLLRFQEARRPINSPARGARNWAAKLIIDNAASAAPCRPLPLPVAMVLTPSWPLCRSNLHTQPSALLIGRPTGLLVARKAAAATAAASRRDGRPTSWPHDRRLLVLLPSARTALGARRP